MASTLKGKFHANVRGFGFVYVEYEKKPKKGISSVAPPSAIFIPEDKINGALHTDIVEIKIRTKCTRPEGAVVRILSRGFSQMAGTFCAEKHGGYIVALEPKIPWAFTIKPATVKRLALADGHRVMFSVSVDGRIKVKEIFGHKNDPGMDVLSIVRQYNVPIEFSQNALEEASELPYYITNPDTGAFIDETYNQRADYRKWPIFTIDGPDTKDIDDAISLKVLPNGHFELGVHIADVSHYVRPGSALDAEAKARATSIYLADRVIPMLPHKLSNGICSLNPNEDRLTLSCVMEIDRLGDVVDYQIEESIICSQRRYTYDEVLEPNNQSFFADMFTLADILRKKRMTRGALDFNLSETKITVNEEGFPLTIEAQKSTAATSLIEEFMIVCNETVAEHKQKRPFVFRTHDAPDLDKMQQLSSYAQNLGFNLPISSKKGGSITPKALQKLLEHMDPALEPVILRSLKQARYTAENTGHFGLASRCYCHFTSPIRRYPDLLVHRSIKTGLKRRGLDDLSLHCSLQERNADALEREVLQLKKVQFMADKIGQHFEGVVSGVVSWGIYVQLPNTIEGLVPIESLTDDKYVFVEKQLALFGVRKKKRIRLGDAFEVSLVRVDLEERKITFGLKS